MREVGSAPGMRKLHDSQLSSHKSGAVLCTFPTLWLTFCTFISPGRIRP